MYEKKISVWGGMEMRSLFLNHVRSFQSQQSVLKHMEVIKYTVYEYEA